MNALDQVVRAIYQQRALYMRENIVTPNELVIRVRVNAFTRRALIACSTLFIPMDPKGFKEEILGGPLEVERDIPNDTYYLDLLVCNQVVTQLKFTLQGDGVMSS